MKKIILFTLTMMLSCAMMAQESAAYQFTFEDCIRFAFANSYERKSMQLTGKSLEATYEQSKLQRLPNLSASFGQNISNNENGWSSSGNVGVGTSVTIYQGGQINNTIEQNRLNLERNEVQMERYDNQTIAQILQSFLTILGNQERLKYLLDVMKTSGEQLRQGQSKYQVGLILESDYLLLEAQYYSDSNNVVDTRINIENNLLDLKVLLSMDPTDQLEIISPNTDNLDELKASLPSEEEALSLAMAYMPDIRMGDYDIKIAEKSVTMAKGNYLPSISANANIGMGVFSFDGTGMKQWCSKPTESAGISVNIPIFNRGATKANVKKSQIALEQSRLDYEQTQLAVRQTVVQAYRDVISAYNAFKVSEVKENAYNKSFDAYNIQYRYGKITTVELLQQQNNYLNALNTYLQNKYSLLMKRKILDIYMGKSISL
ncbi:MAG: TolC family protein [Bacteroidales bacterium]|nr:TolC family protein [Bacteroidales bacterium]MBQ6101951.1 TolC family protein [Bacteroidales bacterium]